MVNTYTTGKRYIEKLLVPQIVPSFKCKSIYLFFFSTKMTVMNIWKAKLFEYLATTIMYPVTR